MTTPRGQARRVDAPLRAQPPSGAATGLPRRRLLAGAAAAAAGGLAAATLGGCGPLLPGADDPGIPSAAPDALEPLLRAELALLSGYDAAIAKFPALAGRLRGVRADHAAHAQALRARLDPRRSALIPATVAAAPAAAATGPAALAALAAAERAAAQRATTACLTAAGERAAVLASIAASEASHLVVVG